MATGETSEITLKYSSSKTTPWLGSFESLSGLSGLSGCSEEYWVSEFIFEYDARQIEVVILSLTDKNLKNKAMPFTEYSEYSF